MVKVRRWPADVIVTNTGAKAVVADNRVDEISAGYEGVGGLAREVCGLSVPFFGQRR